MFVLMVVNGGWKRLIIIKDDKVVSVFPNKPNIMDVINLGYGENKTEPDLSLEISKRTREMIEESLVGASLEESGMMTFYP